MNKHVIHRPGISALPSSRWKSGKDRAHVSRIELTTKATNRRFAFTHVNMNSFRVARAALRARPSALRVPMQRRTYAEAVPDKVGSP